MTSMLASLTEQVPDLLTQIGPGLIILMFVIGLILVLLELVIPGVMIGLVGGGLMIASIFFAFRDQGVTMGIGLVAITVVVVPLTLIWTLRKATLTETMPSEAGFTSADTSLAELIGQRGQAVTALRPAGSARFGPQKVNVVSRSEFIKKDAPVEVVEVEGSRVVVREVTAS